MFASKTRSTVFSRRFFDVDNGFPHQQQAVNVSGLFCSSEFQEEFRFPETFDPPTNFGISGIQEEQDDRFVFGKAECKHLEKCLSAPSSLQGNDDSITAALSIVGLVAGRHISSNYNYDCNHHDKNKPIAVLEEQAIRLSISAKRRTSVDWLRMLGKPQTLNTAQPNTSSSITTISASTSKRMYRKLNQANKYYHLSADNVLLKKKKKKKSSKQVTKSNTEQYVSSGIMIPINKSS